MVSWNVCYTFRRNGFRYFPFILVIVLVKLVFLEHLGLGIQEWTKWHFWKTIFKKFEVMVYLDRHVTSSFLEAVFHRFYMVYSGIPWPVWSFSSLCKIKIFLQYRKLFRTVWAFRFMMENKISLYFTPYVNINIMHWRAKC